MTFRLTNFHIVKRNWGTDARNGKQMPEAEVVSLASVLN